jgi:hypothetical protein
VRGTILFHKIGLVEQPYKSLGRSLPLELSVVLSVELDAEQSPARSKSIHNGPDTFWYGTSDLYVRFGHSLP